MRVACGGDDRLVDKRLLTRHVEVLLDRVSRRVGADRRPMPVSVPQGIRQAGSHEHADLVDAVLGVVELVGPVVAVGVVLERRARRERDHRRGRLLAGAAREGARCARSDRGWRKRGPAGAADLVDEDRVAAAHHDPVTAAQRGGVAQGSGAGEPVPGDEVVADLARADATAGTAGRGHLACVLDLRAGGVVGRARVAHDGEVTQPDRGDGDEGAPWLGGRRLGGRVGVSGGGGCRRRRARRTTLCGRLCRGRATRVVHGAGRGHRDDCRGEDEVTACHPFERTPGRQPSRTGSASTPWTIASR